ncbi:MAG: hypothetical protein AAF488_12915, partial [Planctomycetota bacterium]
MVPLTVAFLLCELLFVCPDLTSADQIAYRRAGEELVEYLSLDSRLSARTLVHEPKPTGWETVAEVTIRIFGNFGSTKETISLRR